MSKAWGQGSTRAYRTARAQVMQRDSDEGWGCRAHDEGWCARSHAKPHTCTGVGEQAHHTLGKQHGDDPAHMVASCAPCNNAIGQPTQLTDRPIKGVTKW